MAAFYQMFSTVPRPPVVAHVCEDLACRLNGAEDVCADLERALGQAGEPALGGEATWLRTPCLGRCERGPTALFTVAGLVPETIAAAPVDAAAVVGQLERSLAGRKLVPPTLPVEVDEDRLANVRRSIPQAGRPGLGSCAARAWPTRAASTTTSPPGATRACGGRSRSGRPR